jgi:hypothetical protein
VAHGVLSRWLQLLKGELPPTLPVSAARRAEIRAAVERSGRWEHHEEWRISTVTSSLIERTGESGHRRYRVRVECDFVLEARCPTLARAAEIAHVYERLIPPLWMTYGWPGWASRSRLEADDDANGGQCSP